MSVQYNRCNILVNGETFNENGPGYVFGVNISMDAGATWVDGMSADYTALALHGNLHPELDISEFLTADGIPVDWMAFDWATEKIDFQIIPSISSVIGGDAYATTTTMLILPKVYWVGASYAWDVNSAASRGNRFYIQQKPTWISL